MNDSFEKWFAQGDLSAADVDHADCFSRTERGWPGHFIAAHNCEFHRNTLLECGERRIVVSTVGRYAPRDSKQYEEIGLGRYAETMAFEATKAQCGCWVADVTRQLDFSSPWTKDTPDVHGLDEMHEAAVDELAAMMATPGMP